MIPDQMIKLSTFSLKFLLFFIALIPLSIMVWKTINDDLGANPVETLTQMSGLWSLRFLLITLALTPFRMLFKQAGVIKYRRMLGLFTFFYSSIHFVIFIVLENSLSWRYILEDIYDSPTVDVIALLCILHLVLSEKADLSAPLFYGIILLALLVVRGVVRNNKKNASTAN